MGWIWAFLLAIVFIFHYLLFGPRNRKKLPPGPIGLPILGHFHLLGENPHQDLSRLARKHGPIMGLRMGLVPTIVVSSPAAAELILNTHDLVFASRPRQDAARQLSYGQRNLVFGPYGPYWRNMRKLVSMQLLRNSKMNQFGPMRKAEVGLMVGSLKRAADSGETVDLSDRISAVVGDMNCLMILGRKYSDRELDDEMGFKSLFAEVLEAAGRFNLADYFPFIGVLDLQGLNRKMKRLTNIYDGFIEKIIDDHIQNKMEKKQSEDNFVDTLLDIMDSDEAEFEFDRRNIKAVLLDMLIAGIDTSATATEWAMTELLRHPSIMKKLQHELESVVGLGSMVEESHLDHKLEYLDYVVKETLRLHPVAPLLIPHESTEDCDIEGFHIPKKSRVIVNTYAIGKDPNVWSNPEDFIPERFIGSDIDLKGHDFELLPFGSGRRGCPGLQLGLKLLKLVLAQLVHCFDWKLPEGMQPSDVDMSEHFGLVLSRSNHLMAIPKFRLHIYFN